MEGGGLRPRVERKGPACTQWLNGRGRSAPTSRNASCRRLLVRTLPRASAIAENRPTQGQRGQPQGSASLSLDGSTSRATGFRAPQLAFELFHFFGDRMCGTRLHAASSRGYATAKGARRCQGGRGAHGTCGFHDGNRLRDGWRTGLRPEARATGGGFSS